MAGALVKIFISGVDASDLSHIVLLGTVGDLLPILSIPGHIAQNVTNVITTLTNTNISLDVSTLSLNFGLPLALTLDALGSPVTTAIAVARGTSAFIGAVQAGDPLAALTVLVDAPANVANGFLNGEATLSIPIPTSAIPVPGVTSAALNIPVGGILAPLQTLSVSAVVFGSPITIPLGGTPVGGIVPALVNFAPRTAREGNHPQLGRPRGPRTSGWH